MFFFLKLISFDIMNYQIDLMIMKYIYIEMIFKMIWLKNVEINFSDFEFDIINKIDYSMHNYYNYDWKYQIFMIYNKLFIKFNIWVIIISHQ